MNDGTNKHFVLPNPSQPTAQGLAKTNWPKKKAMQAKESPESLRKDDRGEGAVVRRTTADDRRFWILRLTSQGLRAIETIAGEHGRWKLGMFSALNSLAVRQVDARLAALGVHILREDA